MRFLYGVALREGATYYSDEYAVLDERGRVHSFPRPLSIREKEGALSVKRPAVEFGARTGTKPIPVGLVAVTSYKEGARFQPRRMSEGRAVLELLANMRRWRLSKRLRNWTATGIRPRR